MLTLKNTNKIRETRAACDMLEDLTGFRRYPIYQGIGPLFAACKLIRRVRTERGQSSSVPSEARDLDSEMLETGSPSVYC